MGNVGELLTAQHEGDPHTDGRCQPQDCSSAGLSGGSVQHREGHTRPLPATTAGCNGFPPDMHHSTSKPART